MFERRLKVFLGVLLGVMCVLSLRAFHLQVVTRNQWRKEAEDFAKRAVYVETTRGKILDHRGAELAVDEGCMDACVDYRAISRNAKWITDLAARRLIERLGDQYRKAPKAARIAMVDDETKQVHREIDQMWALLAEVSGQEITEIEELTHTIDLKVAMRSRWVQYKRFQLADAARDEKGPPAWYRRWLIDGGDGGPQVDDFEQESGEAVDIHPIVKNISNDVYLRLAKAQAQCPGLVLRPGTIRRYPYGRAGAHLLGNLTPVIREDLTNDPNFEDELRKYEFTDVIGRGGLEALCEPALRGARGKLLRQIGKQDELVTGPQPGRNVRATIDIELQAELQQMFAKMDVPSNHKDGPPIKGVPMHGAAVVIDVKTGQVRALASYPDFDANDLQQNYAKLTAPEMEREAPLMNRATQSQLEPGSTIKPLVGLAAITQKLNVPGVGEITHERGIECTGFLVLNGRRITAGGRCWVATKFFQARHGDVAHHPIPIPHKGSFGNPNGFLSFSDALERSCNVYFETIADTLGVQGLAYWYGKFGLGRETGLGIPEARGYLPDRIRTPMPSVAWFSGIGQTGVLATPVQMANFAATIARDGVWVRPRLVADADVPLNPVLPRDRAVIPDRMDLGLSKEALAACREGMVRVVNSDAGTGGNARMKEVVIAGKTGTAEASKLLGDEVLGADGKPMIDPKTGRTVRMELPLATADQTTATPWYRGWGEDGTQRNHAWFIGFAPAHEPQVAFAVMIQYGGSGNFAAQTSTKLVEKCIEHGYIDVKR